MSAPMVEPRVTALMPVKEFHPELLRRALASMQEQTSDAWRLLVIVEDPASELLMATLAPALQDERVRVVANEGRRLAGAINTGMRHAETEYTGILLGDDMWAREAVEVLSGCIDRSPDVDFFHSSRVMVDKDDAPISRLFAARERFTLEDFADGSPVKHLLCWRRSAGLAIGGLDETLNSVGPDDYDFPWCMAEAGNRFEAVPECLYLYRDHRESYRLTTHLPRSTHKRELRRILRKHGLGRLRVERSVARAGMTYMRQCLYRSPADRWVKERLGVDPQRGWREEYR
jgi:glycosyltransferase involved in cell wall biosynthesis